jgi:UDP-glucose 4-epimerase
VWFAAAEAPGDWQSSEVRVRNVLVTGSAGHLGEALMRTLPDAGYRGFGIDIKPSPFTNAVGTILDRTFVRRCLRDVDAVVHTATLHKPHVATHTRQEFVDTNITGTLTLLEEAVAAGIRTFVYTSTTSAFGRALTPHAGAPAAWITEDVVPLPKNIYGVTKTAAEDLCEIVHRTHGLPCVVLRTSRFFPEPDDNPAVRSGYDDTNAKVNELLYRRADIADVVTAHLQALERAAAVGFGRYIITATTPFDPDHLAELRTSAPSVLKRLLPRYEETYRRRGWVMFPGIDRIYVNEKARRELGWNPKYNFDFVLELLDAGEEPRSPLARAVGSKGYHAGLFADGVYPVE